MRLIALFISIVLFTIVLGLGVINSSTYIDMVLDSGVHHVSVGNLVMIAALVSNIATIFFGASQGWYSSNSEDVLKKKYEDAKLKHEVESDTIKQLEAKVETLEKALEQATK